MQKETAKEKAAWLVKEQARAVLCLSGIILSSSDSGTTSTDNDDAPSIADTYTEDYYRFSGDRKGKGSAMKW